MGTGFKFTAPIEEVTPVSVIETETKRDFRVEVYESERGWGSSTEYWYASTLEEALEKMRGINAENVSPTAPDWYQVARGVEQFEPDSRVWVKVR
jgi:hypothetical protein